MISHPTAKDAWLVLLVAAVVAVLLALAATSALGADRFGLGLFLGSALLVAGLFCSFAVYEITDRDLVVRSALYRVRFATIPLAAIVAVEPTRNPLSAPAWSLDRLRIDYRAGDRQRFALVSPRDRDAFLADLARAAPHLRRDGGRLVG